MLELYMHPLASYCWKALLALYETDTPFTPHVIDLAPNTFATRCLSKMSGASYHSRSTSTSEPRASS